MLGYFLAAPIHVQTASGLAVDGIVKNVFGFSSPATFIILVGILKAILAAMGFEEIKFLNQLAVPALVFLAAWMLTDLRPFVRGFEPLIHANPISKNAALK